MPQQLGNTTYYSTEEVAVIINRDTQTARRRIKKGIIKAEEINNGYMVSHKSLVKHLNEFEALPESMIDYRLHNKPINNAQESVSH